MQIFVDRRNHLRPPMPKPITDLNVKPISYPRNCSTFALQDFLTTKPAIWNVDWGIPTNFNSSVVRQKYINQSNHQLPAEGTYVTEYSVLLENYAILYNYLVNYTNHSAAIKQRLSKAQIRIPTKASPIIKRTELESGQFATALIWCSSICLECSLQQLCLMSTGYQFVYGQRWRRISSDPWLGRIIFVA